MAESWDAATLAALIKAAALDDADKGNTTGSNDFLGLFGTGGSTAAPAASTTAPAADILAAASVVTEELARDPAASENEEEDGVDDVGETAQGGDLASDPCSNDNPEWDSEEPCPKGIFDDVKEAPDTNESTDLDGGNGGGATAGNSGGDAAGTTGPTNGNGPNDGDNANSQPSDTVDPATHPSFYSCAASEDDLALQENTGAVEKLEVQFDYEVYTAPGADVAEVLGAFERQMANGVASSLGLTDCPGSAAEVAVEFAKRTAGLPGGVRRSLQTMPLLGMHRALVGSSNVVGLSMDPEDELDAETLECSSSATLNKPSTCSPIVGLMTAWVSSSQRRQLRTLASTKEEQEEILLNEVQSYIEQNPAPYTNNDLLHVAYVGDRDLEVDASTADKGTTSQELETEDGGNALAISLALVALVLVLAVVGAAWAYRRRRSSSRSVESGAFPGLTPESDGVRQDFSDEDDTEMAVQDENVPSANLFGLDGKPSDASFVSDGLSPVPVPPSSLAALGAASTLAQRLSEASLVSKGETPASPPVEPGSPMLSPGCPVNSPATSDYQAEEEDASDASGRSDLEPKRLEMGPTQEIYDMAPISPVNTEDDHDDSTISSTFEHLDEYDKENITPGLLGSPTPLSSPEAEPMPSPSESTVVASNRPEPFPDAPAMPDEDEDDSELGIV